MSFLSIVLIIVVALEHLYFLILEMFFWNKPIGMKAFGLKSKQFAEDTKVLAANQGLYNGFLAVGLILSLIQNNTYFVVFFLVCVIIAGIYAAYSTKKTKVFYIQGIPAILAMISIMVTVF